MPGKKYQCPRTSYGNANVSSEPRLELERVVVFDQQDRFDVDSVALMKYDREPIFVGDTYDLLIKSQSREKFDTCRRVIRIATLGFT